MFCRAADVFPLRAVKAVGSYRTRQEFNRFSAIGLIIFWKVPKTV